MRNKVGNSDVDAIRNLLGLVIKLIAYNNGASRRPALVLVALQYGASICWGASNVSPEDRAAIEKSLDDICSDVARLGRSRASVANRLAAIVEVIEKIYAEAGGK